MSKAKPRVALVHDRLCNRGGGEMIALAMAKHFQADVFTAKYKPENTFDYAQKLNVTEISPGKTYSSEVKDIFVRMKDALKFAALDLKEYDFVILSGTYAFFAAKKNPNNLLYCHSPNRFVYDLYYPYRREFSQSNFLKGVAFSAWKNFWEPIDQAHFRKVKNIVTNSRNVGLRVQRYYGRDDYRVVHTGIDLEAFKAGKSGDYFLSVQRAMPSKRLDLQLDVFEELPGENLKIVGQALYGTKYQQRIMKRVEKMNNVEWIGAASDAELKDLYAHCKAVIQTPMFEDLGAVPIEAMASGKPCIAVNEEGMQESIVHGVTGLLVDQPHKANFVRALKDFDSFGFKEKNCLERAKYFSEGEFFKRMDAAVKAAGF